MRFDQLTKADGFTLPRSGWESIAGYFTVNQLLAMLGREQLDDGYDYVAFITGGRIMPIGGKFFIRR